MKKDAFLNLLRDKLYYLVDKEKNKEIERYSLFIDNYVKMGQTEEVAINSFGDIDDLVKAIYLSHGLDYQKLINPSISGKSIKSSFKNFFKYISGNDKKKARDSIFYFLYLVFLAVIIKFVFILLRDVGSQFLSEILNNSVFNKIYFITFDVIYILTAVYVFITMFNKKFSK